MQTDIDNFADIINGINANDTNEKPKIDKIYNSVVGKSEDTEELRMFISSVSKTEKPVLLLGETGCGKTSVEKHNFTITNEVLNKLKLAKLKGNVRELFHIIERACITASSFPSP